MNRNLPDVSGWQPAASNEGSLRNALMTTCQIAQKRIVSRADAEIRFNIQRFDSGAGVEDIVREELENLLPKRYSVNAGIVDDRKGRTAGDCDVLIRDPLWSPVIKPGATAWSRRRHFPIEGIYAAAEIKQTLGFDALEKAMEKMVTVSRLDRSENPYQPVAKVADPAWPRRDRARTLNGHGDGQETGGAPSVADVGGHGGPSDE